MRTVWLEIGVNVLVSISNRLDIWHAAVSIIVELISIPNRDDIITNFQRILGNEQKLSIIDGGYIFLVDIDPINSVKIEVQRQYGGQSVQCETDFCHSLIKLVLSYKPEMEGILYWRGLDVWGAMHGSCLWKSEIAVSIEFYILDAEIEIIDEFSQISYMFLHSLFLFQLGNDLIVFIDLRLKIAV